MLRIIAAAALALAVLMAPASADARARHHGAGAAIARSDIPWLREAGKWMGARAHQIGLPRRLWCADFANKVLASVGLSGTGSRSARSFAGYGQRVTGPQVGAIAVLSRGKRGGHVGFVVGTDRRGNPVIVSGNHGRRVAEAVYPRRRVLAYVWPA